MMHQKMYDSIWSYKNLLHRLIMNQGIQLSIQSRNPMHGWDISIYNYFFFVSPPDSFVADIIEAKKEHPKGIEYGGGKSI
jgi:hypothetical protein